MERDPIFVSCHITTKEALKRLDETAKRILLVVDETMHLLGTLTDGDIRRWLLLSKSMEDEIDGAYNRAPFFIRESDYSDELAMAIFAERRYEIIPVIDDQGRVRRYAQWSDFLAGHGTAKPPVSQFRTDLPVVIMAGGKGTRLAPFTTVLPKPLIPVGDKTILELIIEQFEKHGAKQFIFTLNYRGEMIQAYFQGIARDYRLTCLWEKEMLGTAGSLLLARDILPNHFFVSNCDIIVKADFPDVYDFHLNHDAYITIISSYQYYRVPYGVVDFAEGGVVTGIREKPEFTFPINTGVYLLKKEALDYIPEGRAFHMTHLIDTLLAAGKKVVTYPVNENDYVDVGQWKEYQNVLARLKA